MSHTSTRGNINVTGFCQILLMATLMLCSPSLQARNTNASEADQPLIEPERAWPSLSVGLQDAFFSGNLSQEGVLNNAWFISQHAYGVVMDRTPEGTVKNPEQDIQRFIEMTNDEIEAAFSNYVRRHPQLPRQTTATLIIDIEYPVHPRNMWKLLEGENHDQITPVFTGLVQAFARRCAITRKFFPKATLSLFGMGMPDAQGRERDIEKWQLHAYVLATKMGMLEDVDAISPVLYERFSPTESGFRNVDKANLQCLTNSLQIVQASHTPLDILILMSLTIFNGNSKNTTRPADLVGIADRLENLAQLGVNRVIFWNGDETLARTNIPLKQRFQQLRRLQKARRDGDSKPPTTPDETDASPAELPESTSESSE